MQTNSSKSLRVNAITCPMAEYISKKEKMVIIISKCPMVKARFNLKNNIQVKEPVATSSMDNQLLLRKRLPMRRTS